MCARRSPCQSDGLNAQVVVQRPTPLADLRPPLLVVVLQALLTFLGQALRAALLSTLLPVVRAVVLPVVRLALRAAVFPALVSTVVGACASGGGPLPGGSVGLRLRGADNLPIDLDEFRGRPVLISMLTTWAEPALVEIPRVKALSLSRPDLVIICVVLEKEREVLSIFQETFELPYRVATVDDLARFTGIEGPFGPIAVIPTSVLLDRKGRIAARMDGMWPPRILEDAVDRVLRR